jgi:predicted MFS family arabinose efflux permease
MLMIAALGAGLFACAHSLGALVVARALIGLGVAGSLMAAIKASSLWLPAERLPLATAMLLSVGGMGAMASTVPMHAALQYTDWRGVFIVLALGTLAVAALIFFVVPEHAKKQQTSLPEMIGAVRQLFSAWSFWRLALYSIFAHATFMAVQGLWMGPWLRDMAHMSRVDAAGALLAASVAMVAGSLSFGALTDYLGRRGYRPLLVCGVGIWCFVLCQCLMIAGTGIHPMIIAMGFSFFGTATTPARTVQAKQRPCRFVGAPEPFAPPCPLDL